MNDPWAWVFIVVAGSIFVYSVIDRVCTMRERIKGVHVEKDDPAENVALARHAKIIPGTTRNNQDGMSEP